LYGQVRHEALEAELVVDRAPILRGNLVSGREIGDGCQDERFASELSLYAG
jgi:hypothetical protein